MNNQQHITIQGVTKTFDNGRIVALQNATTSIAQGEFVAIMGPSGCGKSTLMHMIGLLDTPDSGEVLINNNRIIKERSASEFRAKHVGFIFQLHNLIPVLTALENVQVPLIGQQPKKEREEKARNLLQAVGLEKRLHQKPPQLSGGERQRVAIARALVHAPQIVIADEPTGSLDSKSAKAILQLLRRTHNQNKSTTIMVTHDQSVASVADRIIRMSDGAIVH